MINLCGLAEKQKEQGAIGDDIAKIQQKMQQDTNNAVGEIMGSS
jgi:hypothetical protein